MSEGKRPPLHTAVTVASWVSVAILAISLVIVLHVTNSDSSRAALSPQEEPAVKAAVKRLRVDSGDSGAAITVADAYIIEGKTRDAEKVLSTAFKRADQLSTPDVPLLAALGSFYLQTHRPMRAEVFFKRIIASRQKGEFNTVDRYMAEAYYQLGAIYAGQGRCKSAVKNFKASLAINSSDADAFYYMGKCQRKLKLYNAALTSLQSAVRLAPNFAEAQSELRLVFKDLGITEDARQPLSLRRGKQ